MKKIAVFGSEGSFGAIAAKKYVEKTEEKCRICYFQSVNQVIVSLIKECELAVLPIENSSDGFVHIVLDMLLKDDIYVVGEISLPVEFSIVGNVDKKEEIKKLFVKYKIEEQCKKVIEQFENCELLITESNSESIQRVNYGIDGEAAIVPKHISRSKGDFRLHIDDVVDGEKNETKFLILTGKHIKNSKTKKEKSYVVIEDAIDRKEALNEVLTHFMDYDVTLNSIISRPTKLKNGKYHFFIEIEGDCYKDNNVKTALDIISANYKIKLLGAFDTIN